MIEHVAARPRAASMKMLELLAGLFLADVVRPAAGRSARSIASSFGEAGVAPTTRSVPPGGDVAKSSVWIDMAHYRGP